MKLLQIATDKSGPNDQTFQDNTISNITAENKMAR